MLFTELVYMTTKQKYFLSTTQI